MFVTTPDPQFARAGPRIGFAALLATAMGVAVTPALAIGVLSRFLIDDLGVAAGRLGTVTGLMSAVGVVSAIYLGRVTDRVGGRDSLIWVFVLALLGIGGMAVAPDFWWFLAASVVVGLSLAWATMATNTLVVEHVPAGHRGVITGVKQAGETVGIVIIGAVLPSVALAWNWRVALGSTALIPAIAIPATVLLIPGRARVQAGRAPEARKPPLTREVWWLAGYGLLMAAGGGSITMYLPLYGQESVGLSVTTTGILMVVAGLTAVAGRVGWSHLTERARRYRTALIRVSLGAAATVVLIWGAQHWGAALLWVGGVLWGFSALSTGALLVLAVVAAPERGTTGRASAVVFLGFSAGFSIGPPLFGYALDHSGGYDIGLWGVTGVFLVAAGVVTLWRRRGSPPAPGPEAAEGTSSVNTNDRRDRRDDGGPALRPGESMDYTTTHADGMAIDWDVPIEMDDGIVLRADVFRPPDDGRYPVIVSYGPYAKGLPFQEGYPDQWRRMAEGHPDVTAGSTNKYQNWETCDPEKWVPDGYVCVRVDSRGTGRSPGYLDHFSPRETRDLYDCIEWAAERPWSDGKVGLSGISYLAINQWHVASLQPPHLVAMIPWEGAADWYRDMTHHGGMLSTFWDNWYDMQVLGVQYGYGERGPSNPITGELVAGPETLSDAELEANRARLGDEILAHPLDDEYHRDRSPVWSRVEVPFLTSGNWGGHGLHLRGNVEGFVRAASPQKWMEIHGLEHWTHYYTDYGVNLQKRFFAHFLKGADNGWEREPRVRLQVRRIDGFVERTEDEWPLARTRWTRYHLDAARRRLTTAPEESAATVAFAADGEGITFSTAPFPDETEITGPVAARLYVSSSTTDADLFVVLRVFGPDDAEVVFQGAVEPHAPIGQGWLRASHRALDPDLTRDYRPYHPHREIEPLVPGEVYRLDIEIWPTSIVVPAGYRVALSVQGKDYEYPLADGAGDLSTFRNQLRGSGPFLHDDPRDRPPEVFGGTMTLYCGGEHDAYLLLPVIPEV